jgi:hypothetical protein
VEEWLTARQAEHQQRTAEIVRLETSLDTRVYALFALTPTKFKLLKRVQSIATGRCEA